MPDSKEQAQAAEQEAQNAKGSLHPTLSRPTIPLTERPADPNHPAHPEHPKVIRSYVSSTDAGLTKEQHGEWIKNAGKKFGNAAIFGAGATAGRDAIQGAINQV